MSLQAMSPREASIFACVCDTVLAPEPVLPPVRETDAVASFDRLLGRSPRLNRLALRGLLYAAELSPLALGFRRRLRRLGGAERARALEALEEASAPPVRDLVRLAKGLAGLSYYGDDAVMLRLGYDAEANLARGRRLRMQEGRP
jgi:hypothetical protein